MVDGNRFALVGRKLSQEARGELGQRLCPKNSVAVSCIGVSLGKVAILPSDSLTNQQVNTIVVDSTNFDDRFVYYLMLTQRERIRAVASGSSTPILNKRAFASLEVKVPPLQLQREIAEVLGTLDDKIESNRRIAEDIQKLAQAELERWLPKPWVVRIADLGTEGAARFEPIGSSIYPLSKPGLSNVGLGSLKYVATADISGSSITAYVQGVKGELPSRANMQPGMDRVWFAKMKGERKVFWTMKEDQDTWDTFVFSTGFAGIEAHSQYGSIAYTLILTQDFNDIKESFSTGTTMQSVNTDSLGLIGLAAPPLRDATRIESKLRPLYRRAAHAQAENEKLASLRDTLLPRLLSGEVHARITVDRALKS